ncbi:MAG: inositol monophosphatase [Deltaproteobacteria bacterium]|nr:inositol monophosphatase [Deltaproteobacteria bacterium]
METALVGARLAGEALLRRQGRLTAVEHKGRVDLVTEADRASEAILEDRILRSFPMDGLLGEEGGTRGGGGPFGWIVDPLDGTTSFVHGLPIFGVSIGITWRGELVAGVVHVPVLGETYSALRGEGSRCNGRPIRVSSTLRLVDALLATGFPYDRTERLPRLLADLSWGLRQLQGLRRYGAASVDLAFTACGRLDGYWERVLGPWDMAAGALLVQEAGGRVSHPDGGPLRLEHGPLVASNGHLHDAILEGLASATIEGAAP